jgi:hypothetical protein
LSINSNRLFQLFKYVVYALLAFNIYLFWSQEVLAAAVQFPNGVATGDLIDAYAATIDTAAWVVLLLMFELETYVLEDDHYTPAITWSLHGVRVLCYIFIVYAFYGYIVNLTFIYQATPLAGEYVQLTAANCGSFSDAGAFLRFEGIPAVVDATGLKDIKNLARVDVINAAVWLIVVLVLEIDVWLQEHNRFEGAALWISSASKFVLYSALLLAAIYWGIKGDFIDFWDAFLWLVAFIFIELNVFEWREEVKEAELQSQIRTSS